MSKNKGTNKETSTHSTEILKLDFQECFNQMRHYDNLIWQVTAGIFSLDAAILAVIFNLLDSQKAVKLSLHLFISGSIAIGGLITGLLALYFILRTRIYYVKVARYVNEVRKQYLRESPLGIKNKAGLYTNSLFPKIANFKSSQLTPAYILIIINTFFSLLGTLLITKELTAIIAIPISVISFQIAFLICFLKHHEKSAGGTNELEQ